MNLLYVPVLMAGILSAGSTTTKAPWTRQTTTGTAGLNLKGKMFTLSLNRGGISFYSPNYSPFSTPWPSRHPYTTQPYWTTTRPYQTTTRRPYTTRPYKTTTRRPYTTRPYKTTTRRPYRTTTRRPYRTTTRRPYRTTTRPYWTTTRRPYRTTTRPYWTTTRRPYRTTTRPYWTTTRRPYRTTTQPYWTTTRHPYTPTTTRPYKTTTQRYTTTTYSPWTSAPPTRGVSVCLRYLIDNPQGRNPTIFTLSPSSRYPLRLQASYVNRYTLSFGSYYYNLNLQTDIRFWSNIGPDIWTRVCLTVDTMKNVAQMFSGSSMSIRKMLPLQYVWSGEPVIDFSGFDGQVTDVQVWDYPLRYTEIISYMNYGAYGWYSGSVLTWSHISYSLRGNTLLEDSYEMQAKQAKQPISDCGRGCRTKGDKKTRVLFKAGERKERSNSFNETSRRMCTKSCILCSSFDNTRVTTNNQSTINY